MGRQQQLPQNEEPSWILCGAEGGNLAPSKNDIPMSAYNHPGALPRQLTPMEGFQSMSHRISGLDYSNRRKVPCSSKMDAIVRL